jgi:RNA polymerase sigma factor (TIGR02999 family)
MKLIFPIAAACALYQKKRSSPSRVNKWKMGLLAQPKMTNRFPRGRLASMNDITDILNAIEEGDPKAADRLLPILYEELRKIAAERLGHEKPGQTLQATALVHEAYLRLVGSAEHPWKSRGHFLCAAAEAMRRILIEQARRKGSVKHGGGRRRVDLDVVSSVASAPDGDDLITIDEALTRLAEQEPVRAELVKLRFFGGLTMPEVAAALGISLATAERYWVFARAWLCAELVDPE